MNQLKMPSALPWHSRGRWCLLLRLWWSRDRRGMICRDRRWSNRYASDGPRRRWSVCRQCLQITVIFDCPYIEIISEPTSDWLGASGAALSEQFTETVGAIRSLVATSETLSSQRRLAMSACEALAMPWIVLVGYTTGRNHLNKNN